MIVNLLLLWTALESKPGNALSLTAEPTKFSQSSALLPALLFGLVNFLATVEAGVGLPGALYCLTVFCYVAFFRPAERHRPLPWFFMVPPTELNLQISTGFSVFLFTLWFGYWGYIPEFSDVGLLGHQYKHLKVSSTSTDNRNS